MDAKQQGRELNLIDDINAGELLRVVGFDFETIVAKGKPPEPIELGALMLGSNLTRILEFEFESFIKPPVEAIFTKYNLEVAGITPEMVAGAPMAAEVLKQFDSKVSPFLCIFVAQNAHYDYSILTRFPESTEYALSRPFLDTIKIAKYLFPNLPNYQLDTLAQLVEVPVPKGRHRAVVDVQVTLDVFVKFVDIAISKGILRVSDLIEIGRITDWGKPKQMSMF